MKQQNIFINLAQHGLAILFSVACLCFVAVYNNYPLFFNSDSAIYIETGFNHSVAVDRPLLYGLFIFASSIGYSLWFVIIAQSLLLALVIYLYFIYFLSSRISLYYYVAFVAFVSFFMGASFEASWLMADVFAPICILSIGLFLFVKKLNIIARIVLSAIYVLSIGVHNSHFYIGLLICLFLFVGFLRSGIRVMYRRICITSKKIGFVAFLSIVGFFLSATIHYMNGDGLRSSKGGSIFLLANMVEMGIVNQYLSENCEKKGYTLCSYKDSLPNNFLWDDNSPLKKTGGWEKNEKEYAAIDYDILTTPKYMVEFGWKSTVYTWKQFFNYDMVDAAKTGTKARRVVGISFPNEFPQFSQSKQYAGKLSFGLINFLQNVIVGFCLCIYLIMLLTLKFNNEIKGLMLFILLSLFINAAVCSIFSGVYPRYQTRVVFLLPLPLFLYIADQRIIKFFR